MKKAGIDPRSTDNELRDNELRATSDVTATTTTRKTATSDGPGLQGPSFGAMIGVSRALRVVYWVVAVAITGKCSLPAAPGSRYDATPFGDATTQDVADVSERDVFDATLVHDGPALLDVATLDTSEVVPVYNDTASEGADVGVPDVPGESVPPRLLAPLSTVTVTSRRPLLRWELPPSSDGARIQFCRNRSCTMLVATLDVTGTTATPTADLPVGVLFWRAYARSGTTVGTIPSATWEMIVGARSAPMNTSNGAMLDVNGDGYADLAVGAPNTNSATGRAYVYLGGPRGFGFGPDSTLTGPDGMNGRFGCSVASAGDVNGDGYADLVVGADAEGFSNTGHVYVYLGSFGGIGSSPTATLARPDGTGGAFGHSIASAGDINADGYGDLVVGAYLTNSVTGCVYVYLGGADGLRSSPATTLTGLDGTRGYFGYSVAGGGDVNGDGYADLVVGAYGALSDTGRAYVYMGGVGGISSSPDRTLTGPDGMPGYFGGSVAIVGDINGDGYTDLAIGADCAPYVSGCGPGRTYVYLGGSGGVSSSPATSITGPDGAHGSFGDSVASAGDVNGDGYIDLVVGAQGAPVVSGSSPGPGRAYSYLGSASGIGPMPASTFAGMDGNATWFGYSVASPGDVNSDGYADLVVGAYGAGSAAGRVYVYLGGISGIGTSPAATLTGPDGRGGGFGFSIAGR